MTSQLQLMWKEKQDNAKFENLRMIRWQFICDECKNVKSGVLNIVKKMQNPLLCKDLQAIGALKKHLEKNHTLLSVVSFQSYDKNSILLA